MSATATSMTAETLRAWRADLGMSRRTAAEALGVNERTLETLEYGRSPTSALWGPIGRVVELLRERDAGADAAPAANQPVAS